MFRSLAGIAAVAALLTAATPAHGAPDLQAPPDKIAIELATVNGSGCREGTTAVSVAPDNTAFTVTYSDYLARTGGSSDPTEYRKNCQLNLRVYVPQGFTYAIARADYRGYASLQRGAYGQERAGYYFQGMSQTVRKTHQFNGPYYDNWQTSDVTDVTQLVWAPCGERRNFNINTELRVLPGTSNPAATSFMAMDSTDASVSTKYHLAWRQCP
ncbi:DUF4360 domain-containing protein [Streptomyces sp. NPDC096030]|uniref:DUF4360 domain-containing protein n=1 Tax=Streptomyces sp. NPDC096030 TaxID=3155423 RepID=UPI0033202FEB